MTREEAKVEWERMRRMRQDRLLSQRELAAKARVGVDLLRAAEQGRRPALDALPRVRAVLEAL